MIPFDWQRIIRFITHQEKRGVQKKNRKGKVLLAKKEQELILFRAGHTCTHVRQLGEKPEGKTNTFPFVEHLVEAEIMTADILHVVFVKSPLDHLRRVVLTGQLEMKQMSLTSTAEKHDYDLNLEGCSFKTHFSLYCCFR